MAETIGNIGNVDKPAAPTEVLLRQGHGGAQLRRCLPSGKQIT